MSFELHPQLERDTFFIEDLPVSRLVLMNDLRFPWLILIPRLPNLREITDLSPTDYTKVMNEIRQAAEVVYKAFKPFKLNTAALGNMVPQLHFHVIARYENDSAWPNPIWSSKQAIDGYTSDKRNEIIQLVKSHLT